MRLLYIDIDTLRPDRLGNDPHEQTDLSSTEPNPTATGSDLLDS